MMAELDRVPFTILTGFLGAGKTTLLNRLLSAPQGRRIAVLVNELGRVAIDSRLIISRGGDVLELAGGCVCCKIDVKNDLWDGIIDVIDRSSPDHVVLETTGIAEPAVIIEDYQLRPKAERARILVAGIVCVVDAEAGLAQIERRDEARAQIEAADRLLLSKLEWSSAESLEALHTRLASLNSTAERASFPRTDDATHALVHWLLTPRETIAATASPPGHHHHRHGQLGAVSFVDDGPLLAGPVMALIKSLGDRLLRAKGYLHIAGEPRRAFLELAGARTTLDYGAPWASDTPRTELVLIGEGLDESSVRRQLWACRAGRA